MDITPTEILAEAAREAEALRDMSAPGPAHVPILEHRAEVFDVMAQHTATLRLGAERADTDELKAMMTRVWGESLIQAQLLRLGLFLSDRGQEIAADVAVVPCATHHVNGGATPGSMMAHGLEKMIDALERGWPKPSA